MRFENKRSDIRRTSPTDLLIPAGVHSVNRTDTVTKDCLKKKKKKESKKNVSPCETLFKSTVTKYSSYAPLKGLLKVTTRAEQGTHLDSDFYIVEYDARLSISFQTRIARVHVHRLRELVALTFPC